VRAQAEAAHSLAASLGELDHVLEQRRSANASLDQARSSQDNRGVPEEVIQQALNVQAALASAEAAKLQAIEQADEQYQDARSAVRGALATVQDAHRLLSESLASTRSQGPGWGPGVPLPGLVATHRDELAARLSAAGAAESRAKEAEAAARSRLESDREELAAMESAGVPEVEALKVALQWASSQEVAREDAVVADDAFRGFGPEGVAALVTAFSERGCQVIYLTEDPTVLAWAIGLPSEAGAATAAVAYHSRRFALIGG
jgi:DNA repair exonuclease SbcCD ATPase subunit